LQEGQKAMQAEFSEFSFGFAFTHEYINSNHGLVATPELPSLIREAEGGYDLKLSYQGHAKFFQFKLSEYLTRSNAIHWKDHFQPHYRVRITTRANPNRPPGTDQHSLLKNLAQTVPYVNYVAPKLYRNTEFNGLFKQGRVTTNSLWAPLNALPCVSDNDVHYMTFTKANGPTLWHSDPIWLEGPFTAEEHYVAIRETTLIDEDYFRQLRAKLLAALNGLYSATI
jgi:hypothetical protein